MEEADQPQITIEPVAVTDLPLLLPLVRAYCEFYEVSPRDDRLVALSRALIQDPSEGIQLLARDEKGRPVGFATVYWTWQTLYASRVGVMNDLYVIPDARGLRVGARLIEHCRGLCRKRAATKLVWETALDNEKAQRLYDSTGAESSTWMTYEIDAW